MHKVLFIEGAPAPYRVDFWNELGKHVALTVWFQAPHEKGRKWKIAGMGDHFVFDTLPGFRLGEDKYLNPGICRRLAREPFDAHIMCLNSSPSEMLAARWFQKSRIPFIYKSDGGFISHTSNALKERIKAWVFPKAGVWLSAGRNCTEYLVHYGARREGIIEYPCAIRHAPEHLVPLSREERSAIKARNGLKEKVILDASQFVERKGIDVLLEAYRKMPSHDDVSLVLIGYGPEEERYREFIRQHRLDNVIVKSFLPRDEFLAYYKVADIFAFPTRYDVYGLVINEAMMFGVPVITTNKAGAAYDLIQDGVNGYVVDADDADRLSVRLEMLLRDDGLRLSFAERSRALIANITLERMAASFVEAVDRVRALRSSMR